MTNKPINDNITTRIIPGLSAEHQLVSLPYWAWYWLEDYLQTCKLNYRSLYNEFGKEFFKDGEVSDTLIDIAEFQYNDFIRNNYNLANDNSYHKMNEKERTQHQKSQNKTTYRKKLVLPKIYKLFGFMSCATTLEAVWERRHYEDSNKVR